MSKKIPQNQEELKIAVAQINSGTDVSENIGNMENKIAQASREGVDIIFFPENSLHTRSSMQAEPQYFFEDSPEIKQIAAFAKKYQIAVHMGSFTNLGVGASENTEKTENTKAFNTSMVFDDQGLLLAVYNKIHLFDVDLPDQSPIRESDFLVPGNQPAIFEWRGWKIGMTICYDLRFPELYRNMSQQGLDLVLVPANFTLMTGRDHWHVLLRARAIENQVYVAASGQWGKNGSRHSFGHSLIVHPWGTVLADAADNDDLLIKVLRKSELQRVREAIPCLKHRVF